MLAGVGEGLTNVIGDEAGGEPAEMMDLSQTYDDLFDDLDDFFDNLDNICDDFFDHLDDICDDFFDNLDDICDIMEPVIDAGKAILADGEITIGVAAARIEELETNTLLAEKASSNLENILLNYLPAQESIFKHLPWKELLAFQSVSSSCENSVHHYLGGVKTIDESRGQFAGVENDVLMVILPHTKSLQTFAYQNFLHEDITTLITNNPKLRVFSRVSTQHCHRYLTNCTSKLESLSAINLLTRDVKMDDKDIPMFFANLAELCPNLSHLWICMFNSETYSVLNVGALEAIGRMSSLNSLKMKNFIIRGKLSTLLPSSHSLRRLEMNRCIIDADMLTDFPHHCRTLEHFQLTTFKLPRSNGNGLPDYCDIATNIVLANPKLQNFQLFYGTADTCNGRTLQTMTENLENMMSITFMNCGGFPEIGDHFNRFARKFQHLSCLAIASHHISQDWMNEIASNCSHLTNIVLTERSRIPLGGQYIGNEEVDISGICTRNRKLMFMKITLQRNITRSSCQVLTTLDLKYIHLHFSHNAPVDEYFRMLLPRFDGLKRVELGGRVVIQKNYKSTDEELCFLYYPH